MKSLEDTYSNGQKVSKQDGAVLSYFFEDGAIKAQGTYTDGVMKGKWIFNKKEGYLWQIGNFDDDGKQHGTWTVYEKDGSVQKEKHFDHGKLLKK